MSISRTAPLLPPPSAAPDTSSKFIATFQVPVTVVGLYIGSSYIFALPFDVVYILLWSLGSLIPNALPLFFDRTFSGFLLETWFLCFMLGISIEVLMYAGWLLMGIFRKREDGDDQKYRILAGRDWWAASIAIRWTMYKYVGLFVRDLEYHERKNRRGRPG